MKSEKRRTFTLVELMVVVLILGTLAAIAIPRISVGTFNAKVSVCRNNVDTINTQIELYYSRTGSWPADLKQIATDPNYFPDEPPECPFKTPYELITTNGLYRVAEHNHLNIKEYTEISEKTLRY